MGGDGSDPGHTQLRTEIKRRSKCFNTASPFHIHIVTMSWWPLSAMLDNLVIDHSVTLSLLFLSFSDTYLHCFVFLHIHIHVIWCSHDQVSGPLKTKKCMNIRNFISGGYLSHIYKHVKLAGLMARLVLRYVFHSWPWSSDVTDGFEVLFFFSVKLTEAQGSAAVT